MIVPDLPPEEGGEIGRGAARRRAGAGSAGRADDPRRAPRRICAAAEGFVYIVSDTRTTGERERLPERLGELIDATRADSPVPVAVGFGIGTPEQAAEVGARADGVIVGSRLVRAVRRGGRARRRRRVGDADSSRRRGAAMERVSRLRRC